jgi:hypothetical protein
VKRLKLNQELCTNIEEEEDQMLTINRAVTSAVLAPPVPFINLAIPT